MHCCDRCKKRVDNPSDLSSLSEDENGVNRDDVCFKCREEWCKVRYEAVKRFMKEEEK